MGTRIIGKYQCHGIRRGKFLCSCFLSLWKSNPIVERIALVITRERQQPKHKVPLISKTLGDGPQAVNSSALGAKCKW